jgi:uncharacterized protein YbaP (TraB family)
MLFSTGYRHIQILGAIHAWDDEPFAMDSECTAAFDAAQRVVFESDARTPIDLSSTRFQPGQTLQSGMAPELFARTQELWAQLGYPAADLPVLKP